MSNGCKIRGLAVLFLVCALTACPTRPPAPAARVGAPAPPPAVPRTGKPYDVIAADSLLTVLVYRGGALASAGHNHVIASHALEGTIYVPSEPLATSFEVRVPVAALTVDEPQLRAKESAADFPPDVSQSAREGTRHNLLSAAVLDGADYPDVVLRSAGFAAAPPPQPGTLTALIEAGVRGEWHTLRVALSYQLRGDELTVTGELPLRQSELGLTPFSALMGALAVEDEMRVRFRIVAQAAATAH